MSRASFLRFIPYLCKSPSLSCPIPITPSSISFEKFQDFRALLPGEYVQYFLSHMLIIHLSFLINFHYEIHNEVNFKKLSLSPASRLVLNCTADQFGDGRVEWPFRRRAQSAAAMVRGEVASFANELPAVIFNLYTNLGPIDAGADEDAADHHPIPRMRLTSSRIRGSMRQYHSKHSVHFASFFSKSILCLMLNVLSLEVPSQIPHFKAFSSS